MSTGTLQRRPVQRELPKRPAPSANTIAVWSVLVALFAASVWSVIDLRINIASILDSIENAQRFVARMFPLDFPEPLVLLSMVAETLAIVTLATGLSVVLSVPIALWAASNTTTSNFARSSSRTIIVIARAVPDLILAIVFLRIFGLGALPGILAMGLHSVGMIAKLYADAIESLDNGPQEAIRAAGGTRWQRITSGIMPQLMPQLIATALHRFDINLRTSVILGYVGVGGIGKGISESLRSLNYQRGMALALTVLVLCIVIELLSGAIRARLLAGKESSTPKTWADKVSGGWVSGGPAATRERLTPPWTPERVSRFLSIGVLTLIVLASFVGSDLSWGTIGQGIWSIPNTIGLFLPPNLDGELLPSLLQQMLLTVQIALAATLLGSILAVPIGIFAARNVVPNPAIHNFFRVLIVMVRGMPELILAIIFVVITGLGGVAGTLALAIGAVGLLSKLIADSLEETDVAVQDAVRANGATRVQVFFGVTVRQALPSFVAHIMYLLDVNIRSATLLGIVGAGGIGYLLMNASRVMQFDVVSTIVFLILIVVLIVEALSIWVRRAVK
ncbi:phosphonate ABC transporter, permease protein PhnE [Enemella sp. A6]|uniref:phosphonate ABC transporter, permease protein PhnE n=1 Tax=Enemella sp. A6 TaxID=3440152 RepID=UPI003EBCB1AF